MSPLEWISNLLLGAGLLCLFTGALGLYRLPDFYSRTHAASIIDTAAAALVIVGLALRSDSFATIVRLLLILLFMFFTSPTASHALAQAALQDGLRPWLAKRPRRTRVGSGGAAE